MVRNSGDLSGSYEVVLIIDNQDLYHIKKCPWSLSCECKWSTGFF
jgi:hypothetical protein